MKGDKLFYILINLVIFLTPLVIFAQKVDFSDKIRVQFFSELDAYPESPDAQNTAAPVFEYSITRLKQVAPFLINGLVYGYHFEYTPSDKARNIKEYFEITPLGDISNTQGYITYKSPISKDNFIYVWVEYEKTPEEKLSSKAWQSITHKKISGHGKGKIERGFEGITDCVSDAVKNAVREHFRKVVKNKPREITGDVLIKGEPVLGIKTGYYTITLDFFLDNDIIISYND